MSLDVDGPVEIDGGYFELRVNWSAGTLMEMTPVQFVELKQLVDGFRELAADLAKSVEVES